MTNLLPDTTPMGRGVKTGSHTRRIAAIAIKELQDSRHNRFVIGTRAFLAVVFVALPIVQLLIIPAAEPSSKRDARVGLSLLYVLLIPRSSRRPWPPTP